MCTERLIINLQENYINYKESNLFMFTSMAAKVCHRLQETPNILLQWIEFPCWIPAVSVGDQFSKILYDFQDNTKEYLKSGYAYFLSHSS
jgi:hypothetical protein